MPSPDRRRAEALADALTTAQARARAGHIEALCSCLRLAAIRRRRLLALANAAAATRRTEVL